VFFQTTSTKRLPCAASCITPGKRGSIHARSTRLVVLPTRSHTIMGVFAACAARTAKSSLGHDGRAVFQGMFPDGAVIGLAQTQVFDVDSFVPCFPQPARQGGRQLRID
jgi:hypothetical protein